MLTESELSAVTGVAEGDVRRIAHESIFFFP